MAFKAQSNSSSPSSSAMAEINIIPLVDIMLVLLIIFMVTAPFMSESIDVDIPEVGNASSSTNPPENVLVINEGGQIFVQGDDKTPYNLETLAPKLQSMYGAEPNPNKTIFLRADKNVSYGVVVQVMSLARSLGIEKIGMVTETEQNP